MPAGSKSASACPRPLSFGGKRAAQGQVNLISDNVNGLHYDGLSITVPDLWLGPLFVSGLNFNYTKSTDTLGRRGEGHAARRRVRD